MKHARLIPGILFTLLTLHCMAQKQHNPTSPINSKKQFTIREDFRRYFDSCGAEGSIVVYDVKGGQWIVSDTTGIYQETLPASTFKIINMLIALETGVIKNERDIVKWVGYTDTLKYGYRPEIYHDMTIQEAFEESAGWVFIELAKKIGRDNYKKFLSQCDYGNRNLSQQDTDFWNFGAFAISPLNQAVFMQKLYAGQLPFSPRNMDIVKRVMITEERKEGLIRAKTGWTRDNNINTGWWVGYIDTNKGAWLFATRLLQDRQNNRPDFGTCRKDITRKVLRDLGVISGS